MIVACMHFEIILAVRRKCFVRLTASFLATGGFIKLFHKIS